MSGYKVLVKSLPPPKGDKSISVKKTLQPTDREDSNMEVEKGEFIVSDTMFSGFPETYIAGGQPHSNGGTPVNLPENSFVFSKDKSIKLKNKEIQKSFDKKEKTTGYTFAELAKQYDVNDYRKVLADPDTDKLQRDTAEQMIKNYNEKLGKLGLVQESMKGFPQGIPFISIPYLESMGIDPAQFVHGGNGDEAEVPTQTEEQDNPQMAKLGGQLKVRILKKPTLPKAQTGKEVQKDMPAYDPQEQAVLSHYFPGTNPSKDIVPLQQAKKKNAAGYGTFNEANANKNWEWYGKVDWNNPVEVKKAGEAYNARVYDKAIKAGYGEKFAKDLVSRVGFLDTPGQVNSLENAPGKGGLAGGYYGSRVDLNLPEKKNVVQGDKKTNTQQKGQSDLQAPTLTTQQIPQDNPFWTQDMVKLAGAFGDAQRLKKYMPWQAGYNVQLPEGIYYDPTRELAANAEQANIAGQTLSTFAGPQATSARLSEIQGQGLENAANILGKYNNLNVTQANQLEVARKNIMNSDSANRADQATGLFDKTTLVNQNFDNAKAMARQNFRQSFVDAWTNRGKTQALNAMNKQYRVDPVTGFVDFTGVPGKVSGEKQAAQIEDTFNRLMSNPNLKSNPELAYKMALKQHGMLPDQDPNVPYQQYQK